MYSGFFCVLSGNLQRIIGKNTKFGRIMGKKNGNEGIE